MKFIKRKARGALAKISNLLIRGMGNRHFPSLTGDEWKGVRPHFSQCGEDLILESLWLQEFGEKTGTYLDVGAFHPVTYSNTLSLYQKGWRGINIDANPDSIENFKVMRPEDVNLCFAIGKDGESMQYCSYRSPATNRLVSEGESTLNFFGESPVKIRTVTCRSLKSILQEHLSQGETIDFMTMDCEGHEIPILNEMDWSLHKPKLIALECSHRGDEIHPFLQGHGYELISMSPPTHFFILRK
jgi:FkbM family methyltransferase